MKTRVLALVAMVAVSVAVHAQDSSAVLSKARVYAHDAEPARISANGNESRTVVRGVLMSGESVAVHASVQPVGTAPVALHAIQHSEMIVVREGEVMFDHDGTSEKAGPGDVIYVALGTVHRVRNVGTVPAKYVVVAIGGDMKN